MKRMLQSFMGGFVIAVLVCHISLAATVKQRTGTIEIKKPDGTVVVVKAQDPLPSIPAGSTIKVIDGIFDIKAKENLTLLVGDSTVTLKPGSTISSSIDPKTGITGFKNVSNVTLMAGNTKINLKKRQEVQIGTNQDTGSVSIKSIKGTIETITLGVKAIIPENAVALINIDSETKKVKIQADAGMITVISPGGKEVVVTEGKAVNVRTADTTAEPETKKEEAKKEKPTEPIIQEPEITEEPAEPEFPEASPYQP